MILDKIKWVNEITCLPVELIDNEIDDYIVQYYKPWQGYVQVRSVQKSSGWLLQKGFLEEVAAVTIESMMKSSQRGWSAVHILDGAEKVLLGRKSIICTGGGEAILWLE